MRNYLLKSGLAIAGLAWFLALPAQGQSSECLDQFQAAAPPRLLNARLASKTHMICYSQFVVLHSGATRTPLWSAEHLTADRIESARALTRPTSSAFHAETRLPRDEQAQLSDYQRSGFDRGHMSPNGDMSNPAAQQESFSLANMVPQHPCNNEVLWEGIESAIRSLALDEDELYVVTGPAFLGNEVESLKERVLVPTHLFKAIYLPSGQMAGAYWAPNDGSLEWEPISIARLTQLTGIDVFPGLDTEIKQTTMSLPEPVPHGGCRLHSS